MIGTVFKKPTTRPLPVGAELFTKSEQRFARWKADKRTRTAKLTTGRDGSERIVTESTFRRPDSLGDNGLHAYIPAPHENPAWWCNGSTSDSGSLSPGSNPGRAIGPAPRELTAFE